ncbi:serine hydrolase [Altericroceibacterium spongiae]|uniref:Serine hydrolase n=1 Tax=Altericroceibacterium spongiae TaxID=2320269 RepID=A0A420ES47_9SPHN|nr:serine hydrolase [Altericroceibacterium spongiae]RKF23491.1 serine hydrolase [Altericroceibacterium spongiae]
MSFRYSLAALIAAISMSAPVGAQAQTDLSTLSAEERSEQRLKDIVAALHGDKPYEDVFTDQFLQAVSPQRFALIFRQLSSQYGALNSMEVVETGPATGYARLAVHFEGGAGQGDLQLQPQAPYKVSGFRIGVLKPLGDTKEKLAADLAALHGDAGMLLTKIGSSEPFFAYHAERPFAVGSAFKLYVLAALSREIAAGKRRWDDVVPLEGKSFAGGTLYGWPEGSPLTLHTLAALMISISDNTATDILVRLLGRDALAAEVRLSGHSDPSSILPMMDTAEFFALKQQGEMAAQTYHAAGPVGRQAMLDRLDGKAAAQASQADLARIFGQAPTAIDTVEWFATPADIIRVLAQIAETEDPVALDILGINSSLPDEERARWRYAGYKGGSETGVLSLNWLLRDENGEWYSLAMSWNDPDAAVEETGFMMLANRALSLVGHTR